MEKIVFITGSSSGIGLETSKYFTSRGWKVMATMRNPEGCPRELREAKNVDVLRLDVLDLDSIHRAIQSTIEKHERIDVIVNNAGYPLHGDFEFCSKEQIEKEIRTNLIGLMDVTKEAIPIFKAQGGGVFVNISSIAGRVGIPRYAVYNATKWGVEGLSEALYHELKPYNIKVKLVEPGIIRTDFYGRSMDQAEMNQSTISKGKITSNAANVGSPPSVVAKTIFKASTSSGSKLRYGVGKMSTTVTILRRLLPERLYLPLVARASR
jgi:NAD(P)-dependent dehydrogenase (short-subunit alcohol dehydrogenase family)